MEELLYAEESYAIRGAIFDVYREMGSGFLKPVYQECWSTSEATPLRRFNEGFYKS
jgi:PD-(D/E)XK nuclease superfamily